MIVNFHDLQMEPGGKLRQPVLFKFFAAVICGKVLRHSYRKRTIAITCIDYGKSLTILDDGITQVKECKAYSLEYELNYKTVSAISHTSFPQKLTLDAQKAAACKAQHVIPFYKAEKVVTAFLIAEAVVDIECAAVAGDNLILIVHLYDKFFAVSEDHDWCADLSGERVL